MTVQVLAESNQLRKEADDLGPRAELDHWKKRTSRFNYLLDQLKSPEVKAVLGVLMMAKSKLIKVSGAPGPQHGWVCLVVQCRAKVLQ